MNAKQLDFLAPEFEAKAPIHLIFMGDTLYVTNHRDYIQYKPLRAEGIRVLWVSQDAIQQINPRPKSMVLVPELSPQWRYNTIRARRSQPCTTPDIIYLPAPQPEKVVTTYQKTFTMYTPEHPLIGKTIPVSGFSQHCKITIVKIVEGEAWAYFTTQIGSHTMTYGRKLSQLIPNSEV